VRKKHGRYALPLVLERESISEDGNLVQQRSDFDQNEGGAEGKNNLLLLLLKIIAD